MNPIEITLVIVGALQLVWTALLTIDFSSLRSSTRGSVSGMEQRVGKLEHESRRRRKGK